MNIEKKLQSLQETFEEFKSQNNKRLAQNEIYEKKLKEDYDCDSIKDAESLVKSTKKKRLKLVEELENAIEELETQMKKMGILEDEED